MIPRSPRALLEQGVEHYNRGRYADAAKCFQLAGDQRSARLFLAYSFFGLGDSQAAARQYKALVRDHPRFLPARVGLIELHLSQEKLTLAKSDLLKAARLGRWNAKQRAELARRASRIGERFDLINKHADAAVLWKEVWRLHPPRSSRALLKQGVEHYNRRRYADAARCFQLAGDRCSAGLFLAHSFLGLGDPQGATRQYKALVRDHPRFLSAHVGLIELQLSQERLASAKFHLLKAAGLGRWNAEQRVELARCGSRVAERFDVLKKRTLAATLWKLVRRLDPRFSDPGLLQFEKDLAQEKLQPAFAQPVPASVTADFQEGSRFQQQGLWPQSEEAFRRALTQEPQSMAARLKLAEVLIQQGKSEELRRLFDRVPLEQTPREPAAQRWERIRALAVLSRFEELFGAGEMILRRDRSPETIAALSWPWMGVWPELAGAPRHFRPVIAELERLAEKSPRRRPWAAYYRAILKRRAQADLSWFEAFKPLMDLPRAKYGWMQFELGRALLYACDFEAAIEAFDSYLEYLDAKDWNAHAYCGETYAYLRRPREALSRFDAAVACAPAERKSDPLAWKGHILLWFGRFEEALQTLEKAAEAGAKYSFCWLGAAKICLGRFEDSLPDLQRAIELKPWDGEAWVWRGEAKRRLGDEAGALKDLEQAIAVNGNPLAYCNRALIMAARGDDAGFYADWEKIKLEIKFPDSIGGGPKPKIVAALEDLLRSTHIRDMAAHKRWRLASRDDKSESDRS